jgi:hypothetical protein
MNNTKDTIQRLVKLTERDMRLLQTLNAAGWLTTRQIQRHFFAGKGTNAVCKRLRKLTAGSFIAMTRLGSTEEALYRLAGQGRLALAEHSRLQENDITIPTQLPRKIQHFTATNDLRFYFEQLAGDVTTLFFFSERELALYYQRLGQNSDVILSLLAKHRTIPDALARISRHRADRDDETDLALEYDAGTEQASFFGRTKVKHYSAVALEAYRYLGDFKVLTFAHSTKRVVSLMWQTARYRPPRHLFYFATVDNLDQQHWERAAIFLDPDDFFVAHGHGERPEIFEREISGGAIPKHSLLDLPAISPRRVSPSEDTGG